MKTILYKRRCRPKRGIKSLIIRSNSEDKESKTQVRKSFTYNVSKSNEVKPRVEAPEIHITKAVDTKRRVEDFKFSVKGFFYMTHQRQKFKVEFHHVLRIKITWKKDFSPKKSEVLTE